MDDYTSWFDNILFDNNFAMLTIVSTNCDVMIEGICPVDILR